MIEQDRIKQENWMRVDWDELDNYTRWLIIMKLDTF